MPERIRDVDALRGFALLGIFVVNVVTMVDPDRDRAVLWLVTALASSKFYLIFSFLFGYSFTLQDATRRQYLRRLLGLFVLGLAHALLLFPGDILMAYAVLGLCLLPARKHEPDKVVQAAATTWITWSALLAGLALAAFLEGSPEEPDPLLGPYRSDPGSVLQANTEQLITTWLPGLFITGGFVAAAFLIGSAAGRRGWLVTQRADLGRISVLSALAGLPFAFYYATAYVTGPDTSWGFIGYVVGLVTAPALSVAWVCGMLLLFRSRYGDRIAAVLAPAGRLALTNYLTQSLAMALVFTAYGAAQYAKLGAAIVVPGALAFFAAQLWVSSLYLRRHRYGPMEWLLRAVTRATLRP